jgi:acyl-CoA hydrolase
VSEPVSQRVADSRASVVRLMVPTDANFTGTVFGGEILAEIDRVAYVAATRHSKAICVTASFDRVDFLSPVHVGQIVEFDAALTSVGRSSMEISVEVRAEDLKQGSSHIVGRAFVSMVAVDERGRPVPVPSLELTTEEERRRFEEGRQRMEARRRSRTRL